MGVLKRFFECVDLFQPDTEPKKLIFKGCGKKWTSKAFQVKNVLLKKLKESEAGSRALS